MQYFRVLAAVLVFFIVSSVQAEEGPTLLGAGVVVSTSPYEGVGTNAMPVPVVKWEHKGFYFKGIEAGYEFLQKDPWSMKVMVVPRFMGYKSDDSAALNGMEDRDSSWDVGLRGRYDLPFAKGFSLGAKIVTDAGSQHDGREAELTVFKTLRAKYLQYFPTVGVRLQSSQMVRYYYGVRDSEAQANRPGYAPGHALNPFAELMANFGFHKNWIVVTRVGVEALDREITKSPIVERDVLVSGIVALSRRF